MREYEIYLPSKQSDGAEVSTSEIEKIKRKLAEVFGGYTHLRQHNEGAWQIGGVTYRDEVSIVRVLDDGSADFDMVAFRKTLETTLKQERLLVVQRAVQTV